MSEYSIFTSESVSEGHPDKIADQISDAVLDAIITEDKQARVACETLVKTGVAIVAGEISTTAWIDLEQLVRDVIVDIGYNSSDVGYDGNTCGILTGGIAAIGAIFAEDMPSLNHTMKEATKHWTEQFENRFKNTNCTQIKQLNQIGNEGCAHLILQAADLLQQVIEKYKGNKTTQ